MPTFAQQLDAFNKKTQAKAALTFRETILGVAGAIVARSPVGNPAYWHPPVFPKNYVPGTFKANWNGAIGTPDLSTTDETDPSGELSMTRINAAIPAKPVGDLFYITNALPYAERLENGWSAQAPSGMVSLTVLEFQQIVQKAAMFANSGEAQLEIGI